MSTALDDRFCLIVWRWAKGATINEAYIERIEGPFKTRADANRQYRKYNEIPNYQSSVFKMKNV